MKQTGTNLLFFNAFCVLFLVVFNFTITILGSIYVVGDLGGNNDITTYTIVFYTLGNALGIPLGKPLSEWIGLREALVLCLILFGIFTWLCARAPNFPIFLIFRFLQGLSAGSFYIYVDRILVDLAPENKERLFISLQLTIISMVPVFGASIGGWISYDYHWRMLFYMELPLILYLTIYFFFQLKKYNIVYTTTPFDTVGYIFYFIGIFCLSFVLTTGQELDWFRSPIVVRLTAIGVPSLIFFILWELIHPYPILNLRLFRKPILSYAIINLALLFAIYFGIIVLLALWLSLYVNYTPLWIAVLMGYMTLAGLIPSILLNIEYAKTDSRIPLAIAIIFLAWSSFHTATFDVDINFGRIAFSRVLAGVGLVLFAIPLTRLIYNSFSSDKLLDLLAIVQSTRALAGGLGAALFRILWQRRQVFYHERLGSKLTAFSQVTDQFFEDAKQLFDIEGVYALARLNSFLDRQATSLALDDCFWLMGWILVGLFVWLCLTLLFPKMDFFPEQKHLPPSPSPSSVVKNTLT